MFPPFREGGYDACRSDFIDEGPSSTSDGPAAAAAGGLATKLYVGTFTLPTPYVPDARGEGIHVFDYDTATGQLWLEHVLREIDSPAFLCLSPDGRFLHAASEVPDRPEGVIGSCAVSPTDGTLTFLGSQQMGGAWASYITMDPQGRVLLAADYGLGRVSLLPARDDGTLGPASSVHQHVGGGPVAGRQEGPHAHCIVVSPDGRFAFAADLGTDRVFGYRLDLEEGQLVPHGALELAAGSGPRHLVFAPDGRHAYVVGELDCSVTALAYDPQAGRLSIVASHALLPADAAESYSADIHVHPSGHFLYVSNRGHDSITAFRVRENGSLELLGHRGTEGATPRNFAISPDGRFLLVANQDSSTIVTMPLDPESGIPGPTIAVTETPTPVCLLFSAD